MRPQELNKVVAIVILFFNLAMQFQLQWGGVLIMLVGVPIIFASKMQFSGALQLTSCLQRHQRLLLWALLVALLLIAGLRIVGRIVDKIIWPFDSIGVDVRLWCLSLLAPVLPQIVAVLLLNLRPQRVANMTSSTCGRMLLSLAQVILGLCLGGDMLFFHIPLLALGASLIVLVLSLGSLQNPVDNSLFGRCVTIFLYVCFLGELLLTSGPSIMVILIAILVVLRVGNYQIPAAVARVVLSFARLYGLFNMLIHAPGCSEHGLICHLFGV
jgi:hypothetical protein